MRSGHLHALSFGEQINTACICLIEMEKPPLRVTHLGARENRCIWVCWEKRGTDGGWNSRDRSQCLPAIIEGFKATIHESLSELNAADLEKNGTTMGDTPSALVLLTQHPSGLLLPPQQKHRKNMPPGRGNRDH
jgi:hypothetical protein